MTREKISVIRNGQQEKIDPEEIVLEDVIQLSAGEQVPSDAIVLDGFAEANEAMLTGESDLVLKEIGDQLLSGSFLASGQAVYYTHLDVYKRQIVDNCLTDISWNRLDISQ